MKMLDCFNILLSEPPRFSANSVVALPFTLLLELPMATRAGCAGFLDKDINWHLGNVLNVWGTYLKAKGKGSNKYIVNDLENEDSWLGRKAREMMQTRDPKNRPFEQLYVRPKPDDKDHFGFESWDMFFTRDFLNIKETRPVSSPGDETITNGCESAPYAIKQRIGAQEKFWVKGTPYSLKHMLQDAKKAEEYAGGTVYQAYLSPVTYHHWHSPTNGKITKIQLIPGSYFAISPSYGFPEADATPNALPQSYLACVATRAVIYITNPTWGEMIMIPIGMVEVSSIAFSPAKLSQMEAEPIRLPDGTTVPASDILNDDGTFKVQEKIRYQTVTWKPKSGDGVPVSKGDKLGMFHFGGSTHCLVFSPKVELKFYERAIPTDNENFFCPLNATIADIQAKPEDDSEAWGDK